MSLFQHITLTYLIYFKISIPLFIHFKMFIYFKHGLLIVAAS